MGLVSYIIRDGIKYIIINGTEYEVGPVPVE
jgi:hypothetical protein